MSYDSHHGGHVRPEIDPQPPKRVRSRAWKRGAATVPYCEHNGRIMVLMGINARHTVNLAQWGVMKGQPRPSPVHPIGGVCKGREAPSLCASREFHEETANTVCLTCPRPSDQHVMEQSVLKVTDALEDAPFLRYKGPEGEYHVFMIKVPSMDRVTEEFRNRRRHLLEGRKSLRQSKDLSKRFSQIHTTTNSNPHDRTCRDYRRGYTRNDAGTNTTTRCPTHGACHAVTSDTLHWWVRVHGGRVAWVRWAAADGQHASIDPTNGHVVPYRLAHVMVVDSPDSCSCGFVDGIHIESSQRTPHEHHPCWGVIHCMIRKNRRIDDILFDMAECSSHVDRYLQSFHTVLRASDTMTCPMPPFMSTDPISALASAQQFDTPPSHWARVEEMIEMDSIQWVDLKNLVQHNPEDNNAPTHTPTHVPSSQETFDIMKDVSDTLSSLGHVVP
jgi:hypothetical protein